MCRKWQWNLAIPFYCQYHVLFVKFNGLWCSVFLERKTAFLDLTGSSVIKLHPIIITFCKTHLTGQRDVLMKVSEYSTQTFNRQNRAVKQSPLLMYSKYNPCIL